MYKNMPWSKEKRREYMKEYNKKYREENREKLKQYEKERYNEERKERNKKYREANKEKYKEYDKERYKLYKNIKIIKQWKYSGLIHDDYDDLYEKYLNSTNCQECGCAYGKKGDGTSTFKCMDHDHTTGLFRNFLCCKCNLKRR